MKESDLWEVEKRMSFWTLGPWTLVTWSEFMVTVQGKGMQVKPAGIPAKNSSVNECEEITQSLGSINKQVEREQFL